MLTLREDMRIHRQRDVGVGVAELTTHEHDIEPLGDEHAGVPVPKAVQGKPSLPSKPSAVDSQPESVTHMAVVTPTTLSRGEHTRNAQMFYGAPDVCETGRAFMDAVTRLASPPHLERHRHRHHAMAPALVAVLAALAACGGGTSTLSGPQIASNDLNAGLSAQAAGRLSEAGTDYTNAIAHDAQNKFAYYDLGLVEQLMGQAAASEANYRAAIQLDPNFGLALYNLAILRTVPSPAEAEELYRHVISLQPNDAAAHLNLGFLLRAENRIAEGDVELNTAVSLDPSLAGRIPPGTLATPKPATASPSPHR